MEGLAAAVVFLAILLGVLLVIAFDVLCLAHLGTSDRVHPLPRLAWAVLIVCVSPLGGAAYLFWQRLRSHGSVRMPRTAAR